MPTYPCNSDVLGYVYYCAYFPLLFSFPMWIELWAWVFGSLHFSVCLGSGIIMSVDSDREGLNNARDRYICFIGLPTLLFSRNAFKNYNEDRKIWLDLQRKLMLLWKQWPDLNIYICLPLLGKIFVLEWTSFSFPVHLYSFIIILLLSSLSIMMETMGRC